jgi:hypothetical protein
MLQLGVSKIDITPRTPVPLAGFAERTGVYERIATPLFARCFWFTGESAQPVLLVTADLIWWGPEITASIRARIPAAYVVLHASHSHSGPQTALGLSPLIGVASADYLRDLEDLVMEAAEAARADVEPVNVRSGTTTALLGIYRRRLIDGEIRMAPNPAGPIDRECTVVQFLAANSSEKALLIHATCHPTTTAAPVVSSEFCGHAMSRIEAERGIIAGFLQGCCGDVRPALIRDGAFYRGGQYEVRQLGDSLAHAVLNRLSKPLDEHPPAAIHSFAVQLPLEFENGSQPPAQMEMSCLRLTQNLAFITFNAEMVGAYGFLAKQLGVLPLAYSNGMIGYVTTALQLAEGGYESRGAFPYFNMPAAFSPATESAVRAAIEVSTREIRRPPAA